jgi:hypothetical protein
MKHRKIAGCINLDARCDFGGKIGGSLGNGRRKNGGRAYKKKAMKSTENCKTQRKSACLPKDKGSREKNQQANTSDLRCR